MIVHEHRSASAHLGDTLSIVAIDLGGSHVSVGVVSGRSLLCERGFATEATSMAEIRIVLEAELDACLRQAGVSPAEVRGVAVGYPGIVDSDTGEVLSPLNKYPDISGAALADWAQSRFGCRLRLENDVRLALLGEHLAGAAQGAQDVVMVALGTGIGGAAMLGGKLLVSRSGHAGSLGGHLPVRLDGRTCTCGAVGCAEAEASTAALPALCREWPGFAHSLLAAPRRITFQVLFEAVDARDQVAEQVLAHCLHVWSVLTVALVHAYGPELVLFGGGVLQRGEQVLAPIRSYVHRHMWRTSRGLPRIEAGRLGACAALFGATTLFPEEFPDA